MQARYYFAVTAYNFERVESEYSNEASLYLPLGAEPLGTEVVEFYEPYLDHYFITADAQEQIVAESGTVGWWRRTGRTFKSGGTVPVCRFHGNPRIDPSTGSPYGPITYFYTADLGTCNFLNSILDPNAKEHGIRPLRFLHDAGHRTHLSAIPGAGVSGLQQRIRAGHRLESSLFDRPERDSRSRRAGLDR